MFNRKTLILVIFSVFFYLLLPTYSFAGANHLIPTLSLLLLSYKDCNNIKDGPATIDNCGVCDDNPANDCTQDCAGDWGGTAVVDNCGVCDDNPVNDNTTCTQDCAGDWGGTAYLDTCDICVGGNTGKTSLVTCVSSLGRLWMDRNLGASRVATSSMDSAAYGDLYQWGRLADGHEKRTSSVTPDLSTTDVPGHAGFIVTSTYPYDWKTPQNNNLWQGVSGTNNPCPSGFRLPTDTELDAERASWSSNNSAGAFASPLKLVVAALRSHSDGTLYSAGSSGVYWSSTVNGIYSRYLYFDSGNTYMHDTARAQGISVRCLKD